jgi:predicted nuclease of predicted toxin-antitoxin system
MKFLIDAQLPRRLTTQLRQAGFEATHTLDLPEGNRTTDQVLINWYRSIDIVINSHYLFVLM